jgi:hypothetical protein
MLRILWFAKKTSIDNSTELATDNRFDYISRPYASSSWPGSCMPRPSLNWKDYCLPFALTNSPFPRSILKKLKHFDSKLDVQLQLLDVRDAERLRRSVVVVRHRRRGGSRRETNVGEGATGQQGGSGGLRTPQVFSKHDRSPIDGQKLLLQDDFRLRGLTARKWNLKAY